MALPCTAYVGNLVLHHPLDNYGWRQEAWLDR
jgi:hypothetical protein